MSFFNNSKNIPQSALNKYFNLGPSGGIIPKDNLYSLQHEERFKDTVPAHENEVEGPFEMKLFYSPENIQHIRNEVSKMNLSQSGYLDKKTLHSLMHQVYTDHLPHGGYRAFPIINPVRTVDDSVKHVAFLNNLLLHRLHINIKSTQRFRDVYEKDIDGILHPPNRPINTQDKFKGENVYLTRF